MTIKKICFAFSFVLILIYSSIGSSTTVVHLDLEHLLFYSQSIIIGTVEEHNIEEGNEIYMPKTTYKLCDIKFIRGYQSNIKNDCVSISHAGGVNESYTGMPELKVGTQYMLFLRNTNNYISPFVGFTQGVFELYNEDGMFKLLSYKAHPISRVNEFGYVETNTELHRHDAISLDYFIEEINLAEERFEFLTGRDISNHYLEVENWRPQLSRTWE